MKNTVKKIKDKLQKRKYGMDYLEYLANEERKKELCPECGCVGGNHTPRCPTVYIYGHIKN